MATRNKSKSAIGKFEPIVSRTFLPRCPNCGGAHPLARKGFAGSPDICPDCAQPAAAAGETMISQSAEFAASPLMYVARLLSQTGAWLFGLSKRI